MGDGVGRSVGDDGPVQRQPGAVKGGDEVVIVVQLKDLVAAEVDKAAVGLQQHLQQDAVDALPVFLGQRQDIVTGAVRPDKLQLAVIEAVAGGVEVGGAEPRIARQIGRLADLQPRIVAAVGLAASAGHRADKAVEKVNDAAAVAEAGKNDACVLIVADVIVGEVEGEAVDTAHRAVVLIADSVSDGLPELVGAAVVCLIHKIVEIDHVVIRLGKALGVDALTRDARHPAGAQLVADVLHVGLHGAVNAGNVAQIDDRERVAAAGIGDEIIDDMLAELRCPAGGVAAEPG